MDENIEIIIRRGQPNIQLLRNIILRDVFDWEQPEDEPRPIEPFNLNNWTEEDCWSHFRFRKQDIPRLVQALGIPEVIETRSSYIATGTEALCMLLKRLAYPIRLQDLEVYFYRSIAAISEIINFVCSFIHQNFNRLLEDSEAHTWLNQQRFEVYANAIVEKGAAIPNCWAFIDGTARAICRSSVEQENYFSGHKRFHCVKYQALVTPDGLTVSLMGAFEGRRHDAEIFRESGLYEQIVIKRAPPYLYG